MRSGHDHSEFGFLGVFSLAVWERSANENQWNNNNNNLYFCFSEFFVFRFLALLFLFLVLDGYFCPFSTHWPLLGARRTLGALSFCLMAFCSVLVAGVGQLFLFYFRYESCFVICFGFVIIVRFQKTLLFFYSFVWLFVVFSQIGLEFSVLALADNSLFGEF